MQAGDLVRYRDSVGILIKLLSDDPIVRERYWLVQSSNGNRLQARERFLELINASR